MNKTLVCAVGDQPDAIFPALREFTLDHVHMFINKKYTRQAKKLKKHLDNYGVPYTESKLGDNIWEDTFFQVSNFAKNFQNPRKIVVHVGIGNRDMQCAATTASFVNGLQAVNGNKKFIMGLPIMRFSYYKLLNDRKRKIMEDLAEDTKSMNDIAKDLRISLSLLSYHVHGNLKSEGLVEMGLVNIEEKHNQSFLSLTAMGRMILKGAIPNDD